ncbi:head GIN domain-containing protein [Marinilabilia salmonicolor]|jgi:hypothetical protein|uniref:Putative autotransporter adhesin-like protein n=1 Tax=Marinilabilia salmonicolor TaxID=989 RepID=A0A2T0XMW2_9BACT|nr:head GIN domain-containing protein [Marinilabilia salmonicolor]PRZ00280.1 putative autotransporter adhesin-like protein [Marinilabilia salmonicolor]RCW38396.1 putative autotransporter adhesin-like protein [Marinilabilia salmonicolor]
MDIFEFTMAKHVIRNIGLFILLMIVSSCDELLTIDVVGDGNLKQEERNLSVFNEVLLESSDFEVILRSGERHKVLIETDSNLIAYVSTEVVDNQLLIGTRTNFDIQARERVMLTVYYPGEFLSAETVSGGLLKTDSLVLDRLKFSVFGVSKVRTTDTLRCDIFELYSDGSTNVEITGIFNQLNVHQQGSGNVLFSGASGSGDLLLEGSGKIDLRDLLMTDAEIELLGSGLVLCNVTGRLSTRISGNGRIYYYGQPEFLEKDIEGEGMVLPGN